MRISSEPAIQRSERRTCDFVARHNERQCNMQLHVDVSKSLVACSPAFGSTDDRKVAKKRRSIS